MVAALFSMNMTIFQAYENLKGIDIVGIASDIVRSDADIIVELQKDQLMFGNDKSGTGITPQYRSDAYAEMKQAMNPRPEFGTPDLRLTGAFYNAMYLDFDSLEVTSSDPKTELLVEKYGSNGKYPIFGLSEFSIGRYRAIFNQKFFEQFMAHFSR